MSRAQRQKNRERKAVQWPPLTLDYIPGYGMIVITKEER